MVLGVGTDILKIERIRNSFDDDNHSFIKKTYTDNECMQAAQREDPILYYATRFAGKEAVFKAMGISGDYVKLNDIEILNLENGQPKVTLLGKLNQLAKDKGIRNILLSLSYDTDYAIAYAIAQE